MHKGNTIIKDPKENGRKIFQVNLINRSYRIRGRVPRAQRNVKAKSRVIVVITISFIKGSEIREKNNTLDRSLIIIIFIYSAIKIRANAPPLYSVLNPDTSSDSPSEKSNGVRLVSAKVVVNQVINRVGRRIISGVI